jgi:hypothetical protein
MEGRLKKRLWALEFDHSDLIGGLCECDLDQANVVPNDNGIFLDLVYTNAPVDVSVVCADSPLLKLDRYYRMYEIERWVCCKAQA